MSLLDQLKNVTTVVADTGDIDAIAEHTPQDATTNPSLILKAAQDERYQHLIDDALTWAGSQHGDQPTQLDLCLDRLFVGFDDVTGQDAYQVDPIHDRFREECATFWTRVQIYDAVGEK